MVPGSAGSRLGHKAYERWLRAAKVSSLLRDKLAECFAKCRSAARFNGSSGEVPCAPAERFMCLYGSEVSTTLACYSHDLPVPAALGTTPPSVESKWSSLASAAHRSRMDRRRHLPASVFAQSCSVCAPLFGFAGPNTGFCPSAAVIAMDVSSPFPSGEEPCDHRPATGSVPSA
jgi:hypothetical protein